MVGAGVKEREGLISGAAWGKENDERAEFFALRRRQTQRQRQPQPHPPLHPCKAFSTAGALPFLLHSSAWSASARTPLVAVAPRPSSSRSPLAPIAPQKRSPAQGASFVLITQLLPPCSHACLGAVLFGRAQAQNRPRTDRGSRNNRRLRPTASPRHQRVTVPDILRLSRFLLGTLSES